MNDILYVCPECGKSAWLPEQYIAETIDATKCFCKSGYDRITTEMIRIRKRKDIRTSGLSDWEIMDE